MSCGTEAILDLELLFEEYLAKYTKTTSIRKLSRSCFFLKNVLVDDTTPMHFAWACPESKQIMAITIFDRKPIRYAARFWSARSTPPIDPLFFNGLWLFKKKILFRISAISFNLVPRLGAVPSQLDAIKTIYLSFQAITVEQLSSAVSWRIAIRFYFLWISLLRKLEDFDRLFCLNVPEALMLLV